MTRQFHTYGIGRVDVYPLEYKHYKEMLRLCLVYRDKSDINSHEYYRWYRNYIMILLGTNIGARIETLLQMTPKQFEGGRVYIKEFKTNKKTKYPLNKDIYRIINKFIETYSITEYEYIFKTYRESSKPLTRQQAYNIIIKLGNEIGIKYAIGCHSLRKSFGRFDYDNHHDIYRVQRFYNHSSPKITAQYICVSDETIEKEREKICYL